jgi:hypothetical protein
MGLTDFGLIQVREMHDIVEVVFPFDKNFGNFLKSIKGFWCPQRKCWKVSTNAARKSSAEITNDIGAYLRKSAPEKWPEVMAVLRNHGCVTTHFEVFCGLSGVRFTIPLGHPCHHHLRDLPAASNNEKKWLIPSAYFYEEVSQKALSRIYSDDFKKFIEICSAVEERALIGEISVTEEEIEIYGIEKEKLIAADISFILLADPAMAKSPLREFAFEVVRFDRKSPEKIKITLEYCTDKNGYDFLKSRVYGVNNKRPLDRTVILNSEWIQKRL